MEEVEVEDPLNLSQATTLVLPGKNKPFTCNRTWQEEEKEEEMEEVEVEDPLDLSQATTLVLPGKVEEPGKEDSQIAAEHTIG